MSVWLGTRITLDALRRPAVWVLAALGALFVVGLGLVERTQEPVHAADRTLLGVAFGFVAPLWCYVAFEAVHQRQRTRALTFPVARHGRSRRAVALGLLGALGAVCATTGGVLGLLAILASRPVVAAGFAADLYASLWGGAAIGAAYAGLFAVGSLFGRPGRLVALAADFLLGSGAGYLALPFPRASARDLLGGEPVLGLPQLTALFCLFALSLAGPLIAAAREPR